MKNRKAVPIVRDGKKRWETMQMIILHRLLFYSCSNSLSTVTTKAFNQILNDKDGFLRQMQENIAKAIMAADTMSPDGIQARIDELQKELIRKANSKQDYDAIADEIFTLHEQK